MARLISHDPFARIALYRENYNTPPLACTCSWCGQRRASNPPLYKYHIERDDSPRISYLQGEFCSIACFRAFHP